MDLLGAALTASSFRQGTAAAGVSQLASGGPVLIQHSKDFSFQSGLVRCRGVCSQYLSSRLLGSHEITLCTVGNVFARQASDQYWSEHVWLTVSAQYRKEVIFS